MREHSYMGRCRKVYPGALCYVDDASERIIYTVAIGGTVLGASTVSLNQAWRSAWLCVVSTALARPGPGVTQYLPVR